MAPSVLTPAKPQVPAGTDDAGRNGNRFGGEGFGDGGQGEHAWSVPARAYRTGMWMALAAITMLFAAFTSAMVVRKGISNDWVPTALPRILWLNTAVLLSSSLTLELSRRSLSTGGPGAGFSARGFTRWLYVTLALGLCFIAGQLIAWRELASRGVYLATNPSSSFFYLLTATHGVHLLGGIAALGYVVLRAGRIALAPGRRTLVDLTALYWHFMDGLWIYILLLLSVRL